MQKDKRVTKGYLYPFTMSSREHGTGLFYCKQTRISYLYLTVLLDKELFRVKSGQDNDYERENHVVLLFMAWFSCVLESGKNKMDS